MQTAMQTANAEVVVGHREPRLPDLIWVKAVSVASMGLARILEREFRVHRGDLPPAGALSAPSAVLCCLDGSEQVEDIAPLVQSVKEEAPEAAVMVLSPTLELPLICAAVSAGARGFLHTGMPPHQLARALSVVLAGEMALPRRILQASIERLNQQQRAPDLSVLSERQSEILELAADGLFNAQIAKRIYLSESIAEPRRWQGASDVPVRCGSVPMKQGLVVDDHDLFRQVLALILEQHTDLKENLQAGSIAEAHRVLDDLDHHVDLAIVDLDLPDGDATKLIEELCELGVPVLALISHSSLKRRESALQAGAGEVLTTATSGQEIVDTAKRLISR